MHSNGLRDVNWCEPVGAVNPVFQALSRCFGSFHGEDGFAVGQGELASSDERIGAGR
jgi:hypothetical protein